MLKQYSYGIRRIIIFVDVITLPWVSFIFIGSIYNKKAKVLKKCANFYFLGQKKFEDLPKYLKYFDLALLPYVKSSMSDACSPLKLYEYLAVGVPILSTDISEVNVHDNYISIAKDEKDFLRLIPELLSNKHDSMRQKKYAENHVWPKKIDFIVKTINKKWQKRCS